MSRIDLTASRLRELLNYNQSTGRFVWIKRTSNRVKVGDSAGNKLDTGYLQIMIDGNTHTAHRLAWLYVTGDWPAHNIDHIDGVRDNNVFSNLRDVPQRLNTQNQRKPREGNKSSRYLGVTWDKRSKRWVAQIVVDGKHLHLGNFALDQEEMAWNKYLETKRRLHPGCSI
jgi:hypothetical protein